MKKISLLFTIFLLCSFLLNAQSRDAKKIKKMLDEEQYEQVLEYKSKKEHRLDGKSLFYKGVSAYNLSQDEKANQYFSMSVAKDPTDAVAHYYKGLTEFYLKQYRDAIASYDKAIQITDTISEFYEAKGDAYSKLGDFDSAVEYFKKAMQYTDCSKDVYTSLAYAFSGVGLLDSALYYYEFALIILDPEDRMYRIASNNIGILYRMTEQYEKSIAAYKQHIAMFPDDYAVMMECIQNMLKYEETEEYLVYLKKLYEARENGDLPADLSDMIYFTTFQWEEYLIVACELFEEEDSPIFPCKYKYVAIDNDDNVPFWIQLEKETISGEELHRLKLVKKDSLFVYSNFEYTGTNHHRTLTHAVLQILNNEVAPDTIIAPYREWVKQALAQKYDVTKLENDGSSFEKAIKVNSVTEEYEWLRKYYPDFEMISQGLYFENNIPYDVLSIIVDGVEKKVHFEISSFFGKFLLDE